MSNAANFPPSLPINRPNQVQKDFFPFAAFSASDPNNTAIPILKLLAPWIFNGTFSGVGTALTNAIVDTAANLASSNPVLLAGQIGYETDTKFFKIGDGTTAYASLVYQWKQPYVDPATKAPLPQSAAGEGQWKAIISISGGALSLPAGGTWAWFCWQYNASTGIMAVSGSTGIAGVSAGGTQIAVAVLGYIQQAICWRIA